MIGTCFLFPHQKMEVPMALCDRRERVALDGKFSATVQYKERGDDEWRCGSLIGMTSDAELPRQYENVKLGRDQQTASVLCVLNQMPLTCNQVIFHTQFA